MILDIARMFITGSSRKQDKRKELGMQMNPGFIIERAYWEQASSVNGAWTQSEMSVKASAPNKYWLNLNLDKSTRLIIVCGLIDVIIFFLKSNHCLTKLFFSLYCYPQNCLNLTNI